MPTTFENFEGLEVDAIFTTDDNEAADVLMRRTGLFFNALEHVAMWHPEVITPEYMADLEEDLEEIRQKHGLPGREFLDA
jgi:hypothetical protein